MHDEQAELTPAQIVLANTAHSPNAPSGFRIDVRSTVQGIVVRIGRGPSPGDPLAQREQEYLFSGMADALDQLPYIVAVFINGEVNR